MQNSDSPKPHPERINVPRILAVWVLFIPLSILNGVLREEVLSPWLGKQAALPLSGVLLSCLIFLTTHWLFPFIKASARQVWRIGSTWLFLTVLFEFGFGHFVMGKPLEVLLTAYHVQGGNLWVLVLFVILVSPWLASRTRGQV
jgi:hypothetical protein